MAKARRMIVVLVTVPVIIAVVVATFYWWRHMAGASDASIWWACVAFDQNDRPFAYHEGGTAVFNEQNALDSVSLELKTMGGSPIFAMKGVAHVGDGDLATIKLDISVAKKSGIKFDGIPTYQALVDGLPHEGPIILEPGQHKVEARGKLEFVYDKKR
jgi:hypothetical protein